MLYPRDCILVYNNIFSTSFLVNSHQMVVVNARTEQHNSLLSYSDKSWQSSLGGLISKILILIPLLGFWQFLQILEIRSFWKIQYVPNVFTIYFNKFILSPWNAIEINLMVVKVSFIIPLNHERWGNSLNSRTWTFKHCSDCVLFNCLFISCLEFTFEYIQREGLRDPIVFENSDGLGLQ